MYFNQHSYHKKKKKIFSNYGIQIDGTGLMCFIIKQSSKVKQHVLRTFIVL